jgi:phospholipid transport system transporter-binding protein
MSNAQTETEPRKTRAKAAPRKRPVRKSASGKAEALTLPQDCTIPAARALKALLVQQLDAAEVVLDASAVERVDTAGLQLLAAFARDRLQAGHATNWQGAEAQIRPAADLLGLTEMLALEAPAVGTR